MTAAARNLEAAEYHRAGDEQDDDGDHGAGQVPHAARPVQRVHPVGPAGIRKRVRNIWAFVSFLSAGISMSFSDHR